MKWVKDEVAERKLKEFGARFTVGTVKLADIDFAKSRHNGARLNDPYNAELVDEYAAFMEDGDPFPMIVLMKESSKYVILSGNHRAAAAKQLKQLEIPCYTVEPGDDRVAILMPKVLNRVHGKRQNREEAVLHAMFAVSDFGYSLKDAATLCGVSERTLRDAVRREEVLPVLADGGVRTSSLNKVQLTSLSTLSQNENVMIAAAGVIAKRQIGGADLPQFIKDIKSKKNELSQISAIEDWDRRMNGVAEKVVSRRMPLRQKFLICLTKIEKSVERISSFSQLQITEKKEQDDTKKRISALCKRLRQLS